MAELPGPTPRSQISRCPICGRATEQAVRPFCSRRCADIDLGRWFGGQYRTPSLRIEDKNEDGAPGEDDRES